MNTHERKIVLCLMGIYAARMLGLFLLFPVLALFVREYQFPTYWMAATIIGLYGLTQALMQIPMGWLSDRIGRRPTLLLGMSMLFVGALIAAISDNAWGLFIGRLVQGGGATSAVAMAVVADEIRPDNRIKATALIGVCIGGSFALAMLLSPVLAGLFTGLRPIFVLSAVLALLAALLVMLLPDGRDGADAGQWENDADKPESQRVGLLLCAGIFLVHASLSMVFLSVPGYLQDAGLKIIHHGWFYFLSLAVIAPMLALRIRSIRQAINKQTRAFPLDACLAMLLGWLALAWYIPVPILTPVIWLGLMMVGYMYGFTLLEAALPATFMAAFGRDRRGLMLGLFTACQFMGGFVGGLVAGVVGEYSEAFSAHLMGLGLFLMWTLAMGWQSYRRHQH